MPSRPRAAAGVASLALFAACSGTIGAAGPNTAPGPQGRAMPNGYMDPRDVCLPPPLAPPTDGVEPPPVADLTPGRLLRRASLALRGAPPTAQDYDALEAAKDPQAFITAFIDRALAEPIFYDTMFELARGWLHIPVVAAVADEPEYGVPQQRTLSLCPAGTKHAGAWRYYRDDNRACDALTNEGTPAPTITLEPWWAPGTKVQLVGYAASTAATGTTFLHGNPVPLPCLGTPEGTCGCGPHAARCFAEPGQYPGWPNYLHTNSRGQRRLIAEEPARLFAHLAWFDRPATDLVLGTTSVGPTLVQAAYVSEGIESGAAQLLADESWWKPARFMTAAVDPHSKAGDPWAWREFAIADRNPYLIADRDYRFDPRIEMGALRGMPAAGMLTSPGFLNGYPRERVRAARALEALACEVLAPPTERNFNVYRRDPAREGPCQTCHTRVDPAAIHFKRHAMGPGYSFEGFGTQVLMPGIGPKWHWPAEWRKGAYPYDRGGFGQWNRWYQADTAMTPVTEEQIEENNEAVFIDFLPPDQTLLGQVSDGTVGPLGFGKLIVAAGAFDRCVVRQLHKQVLGRDVDPASEAGYLELLVAHFLDNDRRVRPFVKHLTTTELFRKGR